MIADQLAAAVGSARTGAALDNLARLTYRGLAEGHLTDDAAEALEIALQAQRVRLKGRVALSQPKAASEPRRPVSPDRLKSIHRRRQLAASGAVPGRIAASFTVGEVAVLSVVAREIQRRGRCDWPLGKLAAIAGVCRTVAQSALRAACSLGLLEVTERRRTGQRSDTNVIALVSKDWAAWLRLGAGGGFGKANTKNNRDISRVVKDGDTSGAVWRSGSVPVRLGASISIGVKQHGQPDGSTEHRL